MSWKTGSAPARPGQPRIVSRSACEAARQPDQTNHQLFPGAPAKQRANQTGPITNYFQGRLRGSAPARPDQPRTISRSICEAARQPDRTNHELFPRGPVRQRASQTGSTTTHFQERLRGSAPARPDQLTIVPGAPARQRARSYF